MRPKQFKERKIKGIQFDCTNSQDKEKFEKVWKELDQLDIGIFVNNVGFALIKNFEHCEYQ